MDQAFTDLDSNYVSSLGDTKVLGCDCASAVSAVALVVNLGLARSSETKGGTAFKRLVCGVDTGVLCNNVSLGNKQ